MPAVVIPLWIDAYKSQREESEGGLEWCKGMHDESIVIFFAQKVKVFCKVEASSTMGLPSGVGNFFCVGWSIGTLASLKIPFCVFVLFVNLG